MITAIGNNFGAGTITFKAYSSPDILVLNGRIDVSASDPDFLAAEELEIYLPDQPMKKSADTAVYLGMKMTTTWPFATIVKARLKNYNTIVIEKCPLYPFYGDFSLIFACAFVPKGEVGPFTIEGVTAVSATSSDATINVRHSTCVVREHWASLFMAFNSLTGPDETSPFSFNVTGLPDDIEAEIPIIAHGGYQYSGSPIMMANVSGTLFQIPQPLEVPMSPYTGIFLKAFFVRGDNA